MSEKTAKRDITDLKQKKVIAFSGAAKNENTVTIWGTGAPKREFLYVDDLADACLFIMNKNFAEHEYKNRPLYNIGTGKEITIKELALLIRKTVKFEGDLIFDESKPDGTPLKCLDVSNIYNLGWEAEVSLKKGEIIMRLKKIIFIF